MFAAYVWCSLVSMFNQDTATENAEVFETSEEEVIRFARELEVLAGLTRFEIAIECARAERRMKLTWARWRARVENTNRRTLYIIFENDAAAQQDTEQGVLRSQNSFLKDLQDIEQGVLNGLIS